MLATTCGEQGIALEPFAHQVGGHSGVMLLDRHRVCKPAVSQELQIYRQLPEDIRCFAPEFYGLVAVRLEEDGQGLFQLVAYPGKEVPFSLQRRSYHPEACLRIRLHSDHVEVFVPPRGTHGCDGHFGCGVNPWSFRCFLRLVKEMSMLDCSDRMRDFIVLENTASRFRFPCVLDVKMGTRQHGDNAPCEKRLRQEAKCAASTSCSFGLRLCGMQVFRVKLQRFVCYDKYLGRQLHSQEELCHHLACFLDNGLCRRSDVIGPLIRRLTQLRTVLKAQETFRFYSSSLLLVYEGDPDSISHHHKTSDGEKVDQSFVDVRLIDFAHTTLGKKCTAAHIGPDEGFLFGLDNLISLLLSLEQPVGENV